MTLPPAGPSSGFTLLEMLIATALLVAISLSLLAVFSSSGDAVAEMTALAQTDAETLRVIERIHDELDYADPESVTLVDSQTLEFSVIQGWSGFGPVLGPARLLSLASNRLAIDGAILVEDVTAGSMTITGNQLLIEFTVEADYRIDGEVATVERTTRMVHLFGG